MAGKVSRVGRLSYTPSGTPLIEFTLAVTQGRFDRRSVGNFEVMLVGDAAEAAATELKIGRALEAAGSLWTRTFVDRKGTKVTEVKVVAERIGPIESVKTQSETRDSGGAKL